MVIYDVDEFARISLKRRVYKNARLKLGNRLRALRKAQGISQENFAQQAGIERARYGKIERGELNISFHVILVLAHQLNVRVADLVNEIQPTDCVPHKSDG